jgi:hypothetical protein
MQNFVTALMCLALSILAFAGNNDKKDSPYDADTFIYHGQSVAEVWVGRAAINVGDMLGEHMFTRMLQEISKDCPARKEYCDYDGGVHQVETHYVKNIDTGEIGMSKFLPSLRCFGD